MGETRFTVATEKGRERDELVRKDEANVRHPSDDVSIVYMPKV